MRWFAVILFLLAGLGIGLAVYSSGFGDEQPHFTREATETLRGLNPQTSQSVSKSVGNVYDQSASRFKDSILRDKFVDKMVAANKSLGPFRRVIRVLGEERLKSRAGDLFREDMLVEFEKAQTGVSLSFHRTSKKAPWLLVGVEYQVPEDLQVAVSHQYDRDDVGEALEEAAIKALRTRFIKGGTALYRSASSEFQIGASEAELSQKTAIEQAVLGNFQRVISFVETGMDKTKVRARLYVLTDYENKRTTATLEFVREEKKWKLASMFVALSGSSHLPESAKE